MYSDEATNNARRNAMKIQIYLFLLLIAVCAGMVPGPRTEVKTLLGRPTFFANGQPYTRPLFATYVPTEKYYQQMAEIGTEIFNFQTNCSACDIGFSSPTWKGPNEWDFSQMDERAGIILKVKPDAWILPRIYIGTPTWWQEKYPEEMTVLDHGGIVYKEPCNPFMNVNKRPYPSLASKKWKQDMGMALRKTIEHIQNSDYAEHIFGYEIAALGSEEWYYLTVNQQQLGDYNAQMHDAFRAWLKGKYQTPQALAASWNCEQIEFSAVNIPDRDARIGDPNQTFRDPSCEMPVIDFYLFYNEVIPETIDYFASIVKDVTQRKKVVGAFYDYMYEFRGNPEFGHNGGASIMRSDNIDFICAPPSYYERQLATGAECYRRPFLPGTLHNKLWFHDNDLASFLFERIMRRRGIPEETIKHYASLIYPTPTAQESVWLYQRAAGFSICEGIYESFFDLHGGYFDHPQLRNPLIDVADAIDFAKTQDRSSIAELLIVADEASLAYGTFLSDWPKTQSPWRVNEALMAHQLAFIKAGVPFDSGLLSDLALISFDQYKMVVFLNTFHISDEDRRIIDEKIKKDNRVVIWCYAPGLFNGNKKSVNQMHELTGITIETGDQTLIEPMQCLSSHGMQWLHTAGEIVADQPFGMEGKICELFYVNDKDTESLATLKDSDQVTMARKVRDDWVSVYTLNSVLTPEIIRSLAKNAAIHIFSESNDTLYANRSYVTLNAGSSGSKVIKLPCKADVYDAIRNRILYRNVDEVELSLMKGETSIIRYISKQ
jgi:hypothetical protein